MGGQQRFRPAHRLLTRTARGYAGKLGGRWGMVPQPPESFSTSVQACGLYPFGAGSYRPVDGAPLGEDLITHTAIATDHEALYRAGHITSPSMYLFGINGVGKSSTAQTLILGMVGRGMAPAIFDPIKGEHVAMARALGSDVWEVGDGAGKDRLNLLSPGPLGAAANRIGGVIGEELLTLALKKAVTLTQLCVDVARGAPSSAMENLVIETIVQTAIDRNPRPATRDLVDVFMHPSERMLAKSGHRDAESFWQRFSGENGLGETLRTLVDGEMGVLLGGTDSIEFTPGNPAGFCFDTSSINESNTKLLSAAMLSTWSLGMDAIDAHWELAQHESRLAEEAQQAGEQYEPAVRWGGYTTLMDEFWYPMRACPGMVDHVDKLSRTNRSKGTAELKVTHSTKDAESLPNEEDRTKARGLAERSGVIGLMALARTDLKELSKVRPLTEKEIDLVAGFSADPGWAGGRIEDALVARSDDGKLPPPPGAGKILLKLPERIGIPVQVRQSPTQRRYHVTDKRYRKQAA